MLRRHAIPEGRQKWLAPGAAAVAGLCVVLLEAFRPLPDPGGHAGADRSTRTVAAPSGAWTLAEAPGAWREIRDPEGRRTVLASPPGRIVSQTLVTDEILLDICDRDRIAAIGSVSRDPSYSNVVARAWGFPETVGSDTEQILSFRPDLVFVASYSTAEMVHQLEKAGAPVLRLTDFESIDGVRRNIRIVGFATGLEARAEQLVTRMDARIAAAGRRIPMGAGRPRVLAWSQGSVPARGTVMDDALRLAGAVNIPAELGLLGWPRPSAEELAQWDPDAVLIEAQPGQESAAREAFLSIPALAGTRAARAGRLVLLHSPSFIVSSHHVASLVELLVSELFGT